MPTIEIILTSDRNRVGRLVFKDDAGRTLAGPFPVCGRANDFAASEHRNPARSPLLPYGDTPTGEYRLSGIVRTGRGTPYDASKFGKHGIIVLEPVRGQAAIADQNGRHVLAIHAGTPNPASRLLYATNGSVRMYDEDLRDLVEALLSETSAVCKITETNQFATSLAVTLDPTYDEGDTPLLPQDRPKPVTAPPAAISEISLKAPKLQERLVSAHDDAYSSSSDSSSGDSSSSDSSSSESGDSSSSESSDSSSSDSGDSSSSESSDSSSSESGDSSSSESSDSSSSESGDSSSSESGDSSSSESGDSSSSESGDSSSSDSGDSSSSESSDSSSSESGDSSSSDSGDSSSSESGDSSSSDSGDSSSSESGDSSSSESGDSSSSDSGDSSSSDSGDSSSSESGDSSSSESGDSSSSESGDSSSGDSSSDSSSSSSSSSGGSGSSGSSGSGSGGSSSSSSSSSTSCNVTGITPANASLFAGEPQLFTATGSNLSSVTWTTSASASPATGTGPTFTTRWSATGNQTVTATCGGVSKTVTVKVHSLDIQINNTTATNDDLVVLNSTHPAHQFNVNCQMRLVGPSVGNVTVALTNPDGRLRFPNAGDTSVTLTLDAAGAFSAFVISGAAASAAIGDAVIHVHLNNTTGSEITTKNVTVVSFDQGKMQLTQGGNYSITGGMYGPAGGIAVSFGSSARIRPSGVNCSAPQVTNLRMAIMQESSSFRIEDTWDTPTIAWLPATAAGTTVTVATTTRNTTTYAASVTQPVNDGLAGAQPLYDKAATALQPPTGCSGAGTAQSSDGPNQPANPTFSLPVQVAGVTVGTVTWNNLVNTTRLEHFRTYCVVFDQVTQQFFALREAIWDVNADSALANQHATVNADADATADPATGVQANNAPNTTVRSAVGAATTPFTK